MQAGYQRLSEMRQLCVERMEAQADAKVVARVLADR